MQTTFKAQIRQIFPAATLITRSGKRFTARNILLQTSAPHPQRMLITVRNSLAVNFPKHVGDIITAHINFDTTSDADGTRFFNIIRCWKIDWEE